MTQDWQEVISDRYQLVEQIGKGGMGVVYRVIDRLTGRTVALKRVLVATENLTFRSRSNTGDLRLVLAQEFRTLSALRHPNIISVLDYGFDDQKQPYYTMDYLPDAPNIVKYSQGRTLAEKIDLLIQTLQALTYLYRHDILHRDLKPDNVLVVKGRVKVLDFGLAILQQQAKDFDKVEGTLDYIAPEVLTANPPSEASDLYAVGMIAHECLSGTYPWDRDDVNALVTSILHGKPDLASLELDEELQGILENLLAKAPDDRYQKPQTLIADLCRATGAELPAEDAAIRESFLQAARFVGRKSELKALTTALKQAITGQGSSWLIGGENGVGKSRLIDELRTYALVQGATVLRGQGVAEGGLPHQLWREVVRRMVLFAAIDDKKAGILKQIAPDIATLRGRPVTPPTELPEPAQSLRLAASLTDLFDQKTQPIVLLLEDLQWATNDLEPLKLLNLIVGDLPLLIVASFRSDEYPLLADQLPRMRLIELGRLSNAEVAELSVSMLGEVGSEARVLELLRKETEGNALFVIETVRVLAEEAGRLSRIGQVQLPDHVFSGGMQEIARRRLVRLAKPHRPLLQVAAVYGREIDLNVLQTFTSPIELDEWLLACELGIILEIQNGVWRFVHEKLREALLTELSKPQRALLHRQIAGAIEAVYPDDGSYAAILSDHWRMAGDNKRAARYARLAGA